MYVYLLLSYCRIFIFALCSRVLDVHKSVQKNCRNCKFFVLFCPFFCRICEFSCTHVCGGDHRNFKGQIGKGGSKKSRFFLTTAATPTFPPFFPLPPRKKNPSRKCNNCVPKKKRSWKKKTFFFSIDIRTGIGIVSPCYGDGGKDRKQFPLSLSVRPWMIFLRESEVRKIGISCFSSSSSSSLRGKKKQGAKSTIFFL